MIKDDDNERPDVGLEVALLSQFLYYNLKIIIVNVLVFRNPLFNKRRIVEN